MVVCPWCGQNSHTDSVCEWCKRPIDRKMGPPAGGRNDLDFLKEEGDHDRSPLLKWGLFGLIAIACAAILFFALRGANPSPEAVANGNEDGGPPKPTVSVSTSNGGAKLVSMPQLADHRPDYWIQQWDSGNDLISNARGTAPSWTKAAPMARGSADVPINVPMNSPVKLENVAMTLMSLQNGFKRAVGKADIVNGSQNNVIDYRVELVWADKDYTMMPLEGTRKALHQVYFKSLRPGKRESINLVSLKIKQHPDGSPNTLRLTAWLDGAPGTAIDEYPIQFGH